MAKYFFDTFSSHVVTRDDAGQYFADFRAALSHATRMSADIAKDPNGNIELEKNVLVVIYDENRVPLFELRMVARNLQ